MIRRDRDRVAALTDRFYGCGHRVPLDARVAPVAGLTVIGSEHVDRFLRRRSYLLSDWLSARPGGCVSGCEWCRRAGSAVPARGIDCVRHSRVNVKNCSWAPVGSERRRCSGRRGGRLPAGWPSPASPHTNSRRPPPRHGPSRIIHGALRGDPRAADGALPDPDGSAVSAGPVSVSR